MSRDQTIAARADKIRLPCLDQGLPHLKVVLRLEKLFQGTLELAVFQTTSDTPPYLSGDSLSDGDGNLLPPTTAKRRWQTRRELTEPLSLKVAKRNQTRTVNKR